MKKIQPLFLSFVVACALLPVLLFSGGCGTLETGLLTPHVYGLTNAAGEVIGQATNWTPSATVNTVLQTGQQLAPLAPAPFNWIVDGVLALAALGLGQWARVKSKQASVIPAIIQGVEQASENATVKEAINQAALRAGVENILYPLVKKQTATP